ncbi:MAG: family 16 glycosylhydrolase [Bacteroidales bacterium]
MKKILYLSILILRVSNIYAQPITCQKVGVFLPSMPACNNGNYYLVFEDNFDGNFLDLTKWEPITGVPRDFDFTKQKAWHLPENLEVSNGTLKIVAKKLNTPYTGTCVIDWNTNPPTTKTATFDYTTGELYSRQQFYYGKYEIRCRLPNGNGFWPAFWTFGGPGWNEIDFFEMYGDNINRFTCNVHSDYGEGETAHYMCSFAKNNAADFTQWHVITCLFDFDKITWQIDGTTVRVLHRFSTVSGHFISCGENIEIGTYFMEKSYPTQSMSIIMNLAIQSGSDVPNANTVFPSVYEIDYVRYYIKSEQAPDCLAHIIYENTNQLPLLTQTSNYIQAGNNVTVESGQNVTFKAAEIRLLSGFSVQAGATFRAIPEGCTFQNSKSGQIDFIESNAIDTSKIEKSSPSAPINSNQERTIGEEIEKSMSNTFNKELLIYPNPANEKLNVYYSANNSSSVLFVINDFSGKELFRKQKQNNIGANEKIIDVSQLSNGSYILRIISNDEILENLFIISK